MTSSIPKEWEGKSATEISFDEITDQNRLAAYRTMVRQDPRLPETEKDRLSIGALSHLQGYLAVVEKRSARFQQEGNAVRDPDPVPEEWQYLRAHQIDIRTVTSGARLSAYRTKLKNDNNYFTPREKERLSAEAFDVFIAAERRRLGMVQEDLNHYIQTGEIQKEPPTESEAVRQWREWAEQEAALKTALANHQTKRPAAPPAEGDEGGAK